MKKTNFFLTIGAVIISINLFVALLTPFLPLPSYKDYNFELRYDTPSMSAPFGRDENGADVMTLVFWGSRVSLTVATLVQINVRCCHTGQPILVSRYGGAK